MGMQTVIVLKGLPGSGKSTWALDYMRKHPDKVKRVGKDFLRTMLDGSNGNFDEEKMVLSIRDFVIEKALSSKFDVIVDDTNFKDKHFFAICAAAKRVGNVRVFEKYFEVSLKDSLARNKTRPNPVPEDVVIKMFETNVKGRHIETRDLYFGPKGEFYKEENIKARMESGLPKAIISDLDGTLALNFSMRDYYDVERIGEDSLNTTVADLVNLYHKNDHSIILVSGRDEEAREKTFEWLLKYRVPYERLLMRPAGDSRGDVLVKKGIYDEYIKGKYNVILAVDDRKKVCRMWKEDLGIPVLQLDDVDF
jgi:predicted kinase